MGRNKNISDQLKGQRKIQSAYKKNKERIDYKMQAYPLELYQDRIKKCDVSTYGAQVRKLRTERNVLQKTFAEQLGTTTANLSKIEHGKVKSINTDLMYNICGIYNTNPSYLIGETSSPALFKGVHPMTGKEVIRIESLDCFSQIAGELCQALQIPEATCLEEIDRKAQERPELCELMLTVLQSNDPALMDQVTDILRGLVQSAEYRWSQAVNPG